ncbi:EF-hand domain-containing protein [Haliea sp. E17]|uniref:EF-hand domain-containing protein n=1 Tax=Haliea sp. E17 TaxID=3401576 RepID=UPI003AAFDBD4
MTSLLLMGAAIPGLSLEPDPQRVQPAWEALDRDGDGRVALAELHPMQAAVMQLHDSNADGLISLDEYVAYDLDPGAAARIPIPASVQFRDEGPGEVGIQCLCMVDSAFY